MGGIRRNGEGIELDLQVVPRAAHESLGPLLGDRLKLHVSAPPVDGAANEAVRALLARLLGVPRGQVTLTRGETGRKKTVAVAGDVDALLARVVELVPEAAASAPPPPPVTEPAAAKRAADPKKARGSKR